MASGDWLNRDWDQMAYFKATKLDIEPQIHSYYSDGRCQGISTAQIKSNLLNGARQDLKNDSYYLEIQFWLLTPTKRPAGSGQGRLVPTY
jgi:hypothetical protein